MNILQNIKPPCINKVNSDLGNEEELKTLHITKMAYRNNIPGEDELLEIFESLIEETNHETWSCASTAEKQRLVSDVFEELANNPSLTAYDAFMRYLEE